MAQLDQFMMPDFGDEFCARSRPEALRIRAPRRDAGASWMRPLLVVLAAGLMVFAAALMAMRTGDYAVGVIRLAASVTMLGVSLVLLRVADAGHGSGLVEIDPGRREIRAYEREADGAAFLTARFGFDEASEISLRDGTFLAVVSGGNRRITAPLRSRRQQEAIRRALTAL